MGEMPQPTGKAPCKRHCEAIAFYLEIRDLKRQLQEAGERANAAVLAERGWWREIAEQLIACHDEPTCPAVCLARERLDAAAIRSGAEASHPTPAT